MSNTEQLRTLMRQGEELQDYLAEQTGHVMDTDEEEVLTGWMTFVQRVLDKLQEELPPEEGTETLTTGATR